MKRLFSVLAVILIAANICHAQNHDSDSYRNWHSDKFSMFIHFGLYSYYGGVWDGKPVTRGYSEQIQSHAGIYGDWYAAATEYFNPDKFDADAIAALAKRSGMRSVIFTSKHHDGFCMFNTDATDYDSVDMMPCARDFVSELAQACERHGLRFGLYFSLIDWNYPYAYPISSHNADFITDEHHQFNMDQVTELLTNYGPVSELWFDMGSLTPTQSSDLYALVKILQPDCMVSGRLGNDRYDFAVMPDNTYPDGSLQAPWQTAASMFDATWSWRSWQERGEVKDKVAEKLQSLVEVVSHGGNYLLNVGPDSSGVVIPFEREVLESMGKWLEKNGDAIYGTEQSPFREDFEWGVITMKDRRMNLILSGECPEDNVIVINAAGLKSVRSADSDVLCRYRNGQIKVTLPQDAYADPSDFRVIRLDLGSDPAALAFAGKPADGKYLTAADAMCDYSYSCFDYYSNYRSTVAYRWSFYPDSKVISLIYTGDETGREVSVEINGVKSQLALSGGKPVNLPMASVEEGRLLCRRLRGGTFTRPTEWTVYDDETLSHFEVLDTVEIDKKVGKFSNYILVRELDVKEEGYAVFDVTTGNGMEVILDGVSIVKHLNKYGTSLTNEKVVLYLSKGTHQIALRCYSRFEDRSVMGLKLSEAEFMAVDLQVDRSDLCELRLAASDLESVHTDCGLHNVIICNARP